MNTSSNKFIKSLSIISVVSLVLATIATAYILLTESSIRSPINLAIGPFLLTLLGSVVVVLVAYSRLASNREGQLQRLEEDVRRWAATTAEKSRGEADKTQERIERLLARTGSISFHFANKQQITDFYYDYFKEPTIEGMVADMTTELSGEVKAKLPQLVEAKIGGKDVGKWVSKIRIVELSLAGMFDRYRREILKDGRVTLGLEDVDISLDELKDFQKSVKEVKEKFDLVIPEELVGPAETAIKARAAETTLAKLENATGWVLIEGRFQINRKDSMYECVYSHPVNAYLPDNHALVTLSLIIEAKDLESSVQGNYVQSVGKVIPLTVYGKVWQPIDRQTNTWDLRLTPTAIY